MKKLLLAVCVCSLALLSCAASAGAAKPAFRGLAGAEAAQLQGRASQPGPLAVVALRQATLTGGAGAAVDFFGYSVALDGDTALVGAYDRTVGDKTYQGAAYVFVRSGDTWTQQGDELTASDGATGDHFGSSVALDGDTALVGASGHKVGASAGQGAAYVFVRSGDTWAQQGDELTAPDGTTGDAFGSSVALDGDTALVAAPAHQVGANAAQGAAYVFVRSGDAWAQQGDELTASDGVAQDYFGYSVALSGDTALIGAPYRRVGARELEGVAYVFVRSGETWSPQGGALIASGGAANDEFGSAVALDGDTALIGAPYHKVGSNPDQGVAYVFARSADAWRQQGGELNTTTSRQGFGYAVALAGDRALIGSPRDVVDGNIQGSAYAFVRYGTAWSRQGGTLATASDGAHDFYGSAVALSGDTALIGAPYHKVGSNALQGAGYVYRLPSITRPTLGAPACPASVKRGARFAVSGTLAPQFTAGSRTVTVKAYRYVSGGWRFSKSYSTVNVDAGGASRYLTARFALTQAGTYRFRASTTATMDWAAATSAYSRTLTVK